MRGLQLVRPSPDKSCRLNRSVQHPTPSVLNCYLQRSCFLIDGKHAQLTPTQKADLMRCFEARPLIGCALGEAHNVFHSKGVLH